MYGNKKRFNIFDTDVLSEYLSANDKRWQSQIEQETEDYILNVSEIEYINHLAQAFPVEGVSIDFAGVPVTSCERQIPAEQFPSLTRFNVRRGQSYPKPVIVYHLPYEGNTDMLRYTPSSNLSWTTEVYLEDQSVCFEAVNFWSDVENIKKQAQHDMGAMQDQLGYVKQDLDRYNAGLQWGIERAFTVRKQKILATHDMLASLGVPIKKRDNLPATYAIPTPQVRKSVTVKPAVTERGFKPEPTLDATTYHDILQAIHDLGKVFERKPATYSGKGEEDLRDHILLYLEPRFESSVTGETFNKSGKTDILIRHENSNVFIAECKFWGGPKKHLESNMSNRTYIPM